MTDRIIGFVKELSAEEMKKSYSHDPGCYPAIEIFLPEGSPAYKEASEEYFNSRPWQYVKLMIEWHGNEMGNDLFGIAVCDYMEDAEVVTTVMDSSSPHSLLDSETIERITGVFDEMRKR